ncbi:D-TA family PLP-dependent enzyme [Robiginitalea sediminis]|uniref:D-TA family PLP-dependent enzyme n=1 Tax=Robiginitalea sediminis TaxID=1982593 RepID=UPI000B4AA163|nr:D-TA family PLP-dependent enzyme [Robiginitalea sediminis]
MPDKQTAWYALEDPSAIPSPALLVYPERIALNIDTMIRMAGDPGRLRPHIKTHKTAEIIRMQMDRGISKFKCATIAEAELLGQCGAADVLLAYQPVGPDQKRFLDLQEAYPKTQFAALVDNRKSLSELNAQAGARGTAVRLFLDLNVGMNRTGIIPGQEAEALYAELCGMDAVEPGGLHIYDGHLRDPLLEDRKAACDAAFAPVEEMKEHLEARGLPVPSVIAGGSPSFPVHCQRDGVDLSPGTTLLWDARYGEFFRDMEFLPAAVLLTRVVSHPAPGTWCLDLGHKAIAPEMDFPRVHLMGLEACRQTGQSEEHLVLTCPENSTLQVGQEVYGIPIHVCPTVAKYPRLLTVSEGRVTGSWKVAARDYQLNI